MISGMMQGAFLKSVAKVEVWSAKILHLKRKYQISLGTKK